MSREEIALTVVLGLLVVAVSALAKRPYNAVAAALKRSIRTSLPLAVGTARDRALDCIRHGDPVSYPGGPNGEQYIEAASQIRMSGLRQATAELESMIPRAAAVLPYQTTARLADLCDACHLSDRIPDDVQTEDVADFIRRTSGQIFRAALAWRGPLRWIGSRRRKRLWEMRTVVLDLKEAAELAYEAAAAMQRNGDPAWFSGPNGEQWQRGESMIRMALLRDAIDALEQGSAKARSLDLDDVAESAEALLAASRGVNDDPEVLRSERDPLRGLGALRDVLLEALLASASRMSSRKWSDALSTPRRFRRPSHAAGLRAGELENGVLDDEATTGDRRSASADE